MWGSTREEQMDPPLGNVPSLGTAAVWLYQSPAWCCSGQTPQPRTCRDTSGLPTAPRNGSAWIHHDDVPETTFLAPFYFSTARSKRGTNQIWAEKGKNSLQRMPQHPTTVPPASRQQACPSSSSCPVGVAQPCHRPLRSVPSQCSWGCEMQTPGEGRDGR